MRAPSCLLVALPFWTIAIIDAVVLAVGIVGYLGLDPGRRPAEPTYGFFSETFEPLPENWQQFLPPGVEGLEKEGDRLRLIGVAPYDRAIETAKKQAKRHAFEQRKLQFRQWQQRDRRIDRLRRGVLLGTSLMVIVLTLAARRFWIVSRAMSLFCWNCGQARQGQEKEPSGATNVHP